MASESVVLQSNLSLIATEVRAEADVPTAANATARTVTHTAYNHSGKMDGSTTQTVDRVAFKEITISGTTTIDLTSAETVNGTEDLTGKKVVAVIIETGASNSGDVTIAPGASNPYPLFGTGNDMVLGKGRTLATSTRNVATSLPAVSGTVKTLDITGTTNDTVNIMFVLGD